MTRKSVSILDYLREREVVVCDLIKSRLIVLDNGNESKENISLGIGSRSSEGDIVYLLSLTADLRRVRDLTNAIREEGYLVDLRTAAGEIDDVAVEVRNEFSKLVAEVPQDFKIKEKSLKKSFIFDEDLSLWWLNDLSSKRSDVYPTFTRLCQLEVIDRLVRSESIGSISLYTDNNDFWDVLNDYCKNRSIPLMTPRPRGRIWTSAAYVLGVIKGVSVTVSWLLRTWLQTLLAKFMVASHNKSLERKESIAFYSHYPGMLKGHRELVDEKYASTPHQVASLLNCHSVFACTFSSDGFHQSVSLREFYKLCRWIRSASVNPDLYLMDADLITKDFWDSLKLIILSWHYWRIGNSKNFQKQWVYSGVDISPLIRREMKTAMLRIPRYTLHARRVKRFVDMVRPKCFITHLFEFCYGRATVYGAKKAYHAPIVIGTQHGPTASRKLLYYHHTDEITPNPEYPSDFVENMPIPDFLLLEGEYTRRQLVYAGYSSEEALVVGAPRIEHLFHSKAYNSKGIKLGRKGNNVLVVLGQHDTYSILDTCIPIVKESPELYFTFKLHPRSGLVAEDIASFFRKKGVLDNYESVSDGMYDILAKCDAVVVTYSSVGIEALALGYPVICLQLPDVVNSSPLLDVEDPLVAIVCNKQSFMKALGDIFSSTREKNIVKSKAVAEILGDIDGKSSVKWARAIFEISANNSESS